MIIRVEEGEETLEPAVTDAGNVKCYKITTGNNL
jgi:hypothetical protein